MTLRAAVGLSAILSLKMRGLAMLFAFYRKGRWCWANFSMGELAGKVNVIFALFETCLFKIEIRVV